MSGASCFFTRNPTEAAPLPSAAPASRPSLRYDPARKGGQPPSLDLPIMVGLVAHKTKAGFIQRMLQRRRRSGDPPAPP